LDKTSLLFLGDFAPIFDVEIALIQGRYKEVLNDFVDLIAKHDVISVNLECPLTHSTKKLLKTGPCLKSSPDCAKALSEIGITVASLANNHILDYGASGLIDTLESLAHNGVKCHGAGKNRSEANQPIIIKNGTISVALISYCEREFSILSPEHPGANPIDPIRNAPEILNLVKENDYVFVQVHGGHEYNNLPSPYFRDLLRFYASLGVSAVIGHHIHVASLYEEYFGVPIFYSLGNFSFCWDSAKGDDWYKGMAVSFSIADNHLSYNLIPHIQDKNGFVRRMNTEEISTFLHDIEDIRGVFSSEQYSAHFDEYLVQKGERAFTNLLLPNRALKWAIKKRWIKLESVIKLKRFIAYFHSYRCEGSREAIELFLEKTYGKLL